MSLRLSDTAYTWACRRYGMVNKDDEPDDLAVAKAFGIGITTVWRVRTGMAVPGPRYIAGALTAWPGVRFEELFLIRPYQPRHARDDDLVSA